MQRIYWNLDNNFLQTDRTFPQHIGGSDGTAGLKARYGAVEVLEVGFVRGASRVTVDMGSDPGLEWILKRSLAVGVTYDAAVFASSLTCERFTEVSGTTTDYFYRITLDCRGGNFAKILGVDDVAVPEIVEVTCVADVGGDSQGRYFDLFYGTGPTDFERWWLNPSGDSGATPPPSGGGTLIRVDITADFMAADVAAVLRDDPPTTTHWTRVMASVDITEDTVVFTAVANQACGWHHPRRSGFTLTTVQAGGAGEEVTDVAEVSLLAEMTVEYEGQRQIAEPWTLLLRNSLRREGATAAGSSRDNGLRGVPLGVVLDFAGMTVPAGFALCYGQAISRGTYALLFELLNPALGQCTITNASPGVVTLTSHGLVNGDPVYFTTTGALPTGLSANTRYFVVSAATNTFSVSATSGGSAINTSSAGSGVHTLRRSPHGIGNGSTTFNVPDLRGRVVAGMDAMGGTSANRLTAATTQGINGDVLGAAGGEEAHQLTAAEIGTSALSGGGAVAEGTDYTSVATSESDGATHNNLQPTGVMNKIIRTS